MAPRIKKLDDNTRGRLARVLAAARREPTGTTPTISVRIKLESLPAPLRAVVRDQSHGGILLEAELPWLTVGSQVETEFPDGKQQVGRVHWFGVDATRAGSARMRIFVDLSGRAARNGRIPDPEPVHGEARVPRWRALAIAAVIGAAAAVGYFVGRHRSVAVSSRPAATAPVRTPQLAPAPTTPPPPPPTSLATAAPNATPEAPKPAQSKPAAAHAKPKRKHRNR